MSLNFTVGEVAEGGPALPHQSPTVTQDRVAFQPMTAPGISSAQTRRDATSDSRKAQGGDSVRCGLPTCGHGPQGQSVRQLPETEAACSCVRRYQVQCNTGRSRVPVPVRQAAVKRSTAQV